MSLTQIKGIGKITSDTLAEAGFTLDNIKGITVEKLEDLNIPKSQIGNIIKSVNIYFEEKNMSQTEKEVIKLSQKNEQVKDILREKTKEVEDTIEEIKENVQNTKEDVEETIKESGKSISRYRLKKQLRRKFPKVDKKVFREFFRSEANKYNNLQDMTEAFKSFKK